MSDNNLWNYKFMESRNVVKAGQGLQNSLKKENTNISL